MEDPLRLLTLGFCLLSTTAYAADPATCAAVRMADLGWTDIALTNTTAELILDALGYDASQTLLGLDVTYTALKENQMDVFLGNWRPFQDVQYGPFFTEGAVEDLGINLEGAKYTLVVPNYVAEKGVASFDDLAKFADQFDRKIYAIEPGSNQPLLDMVAANAHGLGDWKIVETSEAGMLSQVERTYPDQGFIAFLGWAPHPMNLNYDLTYLSGGDAEFGPDFGGSTVHTISRKGYAVECPNVARLFANLRFELAYENAGMQKIMGDGMAATDAAKAMVAVDPAVLDRWLDGVTTLAGDPALPVVKAAMGL
jgi:glycine betaine/proline transport system substrate-binding protein